MKIMRNIHNPLVILIDLYQRKAAIHLVKRLLESCCEIIKIDQDELFQDTVQCPTNNTLIYNVILFENCFMEIPLRRHILNELTNFWNTWEQDGLKARQIRYWQSLTIDQRYYFNEIWDIIKTFARKDYSVNRLFDTQYQEMLRMIKFKENTVNCLNAYCLESSDRQKYSEFLDRMQHQIDEGTVHTIIIQPELEKLKSLVVQLSYASKSNAWMHYYAKRLEGKSSRFIFTMFYSFDNV